MAAGRVPKGADWRVADGVRVEELDGSWLALDPAGGVVYRLEARAAEVMRLVAHRLPLPGHLVPAARELAGHGVLEHPLVDRRTALVGAGVVTLTGLAATILPSAARAASMGWTQPNGADWPIAGGTYSTLRVDNVNYHFHAFTTVGSGTLEVRDATAVRDVSLLIVGGGGGGGLGDEGAGGGGGAGTLIYVTGGLLPLPGGSAQYDLTVNIGGGGLGKRDTAGSGRGASGGSTTLGGGSGEPFTLTALGGGGGGGPNLLPGAAGGSGGGGGADASDTSLTRAGGAAGSTPTVTDVRDIFSRGSVTASAEVRQNPGGSGMESPTGSAGRRRAGGGGGAGGPGTNGVSTAGSEVSGTGGSAYSPPNFSAFGDGGAFAGGGGGSTGEGGQAGAGGAGGGAGAGSGADGTTKSGQSATVANTGSGGGGGTDRDPGTSDGGDGASGVVIIRYRIG